MSHKMDELKQKLLGFINKQPPKIPSMGFNDANYHFSQVPTLSINSKTVTNIDRPADQDILESIEAAYFSMENFDICRFELQKLPDVLDCDQIQRDFKNLKQQHQVVSNKVLQLILEHQNGCNEEFKKIQEILEQIKAILELCRTSRKELKIGGSQFSASMGILANYRKRKLAQNLLNNLNMIKNLHSFDQRCQQLLNEEDYPGAIMELKKCQKIAIKYRHFSCVAALTYKLQEALENIDSQLDRILAQMCFHFDHQRYEKLLMAYNLLDKSQVSVIDNLHVHYITAIYNSSFNVLHSYITSTELLESSENTGKNPYKTLCQSIPQDVFILCLVHLCKELFKIVLSYHQLLRCHQNIETEVESENLNIENNLSKQKLDHNLVKIWDDVQRKVSSLLLSADLANYKFDQFVQVLRLVHRLIQVGEEFCNSKSEDLQKSIRQQSVNYFKNYHMQRLDELKIFLENEMWEICPVKSSFDILQLDEFKTFRASLKNFRINPQLSPSHPPNYSTTSSECCSSNHSQDGSSAIVRNFFIKYATHGTPFDSSFEDTNIEEDILASENDASGYFSEDSEEESAELRKEYVDEYGDDINSMKLVHARDKKEKRHYKSPIFTNTTLSILRQMGKYIQMSRLLKPIAYQIISCMNQLFDYYLYTVHLFFANDSTLTCTSIYSTELNATLKKISDNLISNNSEDFETNIEEGLIFKPCLSPMVNLSKPEDLHGLAQRIVSVESLIFLAKQYQFLQEYLEYLVPPTNKIMLHQFFTQNVNCAASLRYPVYIAVIAKAFDLQQILIYMSKINWEVKDVMSQHNSYIDMILREVHIFTLRLEDVATKVPISPEVYNNFWENIAYIITRTLVQGFSEAKKCSNGGRALMQLDFTQFLSNFEKISGLRPIPHKEYVENYVKAYYLPEPELENWIKQHKEYSSKHLFGLISCACQNNKKTRQRLLQVIEDLEKSDTLR